jgi:hypothetical protein
MKDESGNLRFYGLYRGTVTSSKDPQNKKRIKATIPQVLGTEPTDWMWCKDNSSQSSVPPATGQGVWVMFEGGDPSFPVWVGTFGTNRASGSQVNIKSLPKGNYPSTVKLKSGANGGKELDLVATVVAIAKTLEAVRLSLNSHGGGMSESPPTDVENS